MTTDYYKILGVVDTAETAVIRAAYKALMQIYHPDKYQGDRNEAERKTKEISEAYSVLSDPEKRKAYDQTRTQEKPEYDPEQDTVSEKQQRAAEGTLDQRWEVAKEYVGDLEQLYSDLGKLSPELAFTFKLMMIEEKAFNRARAVAESLEMQYLTRYFGSNPSIRQFARSLLLAGNRDTARELNSVITVLGSAVDSEGVIDRIANKYNINFAEPSHLQGSSDVENRDYRFISWLLWFVFWILIILMGKLLS